MTQNSGGPSELGCLVCVVCVVCVMCVCVRARVRAIVHARKASCKQIVQLASRSIYHWNVQLRPLLQGRRIVLKEAGETAVMCAGSLDETDV